MSGCPPFFRPSFSTGKSLFLEGGEMLDIQQIVVSWAFHPKWTGKSGLPVMAPILLAFCSGMLGCGSPSKAGRYSSGSCRY